MSLEALEEILQKPVEPNEPGRPDEWGLVEGQLGIGLPADYKQFIEVFGTGKIDDFIVILNPFSANAFIDFLKANRELLEADEFLRKKHPKDYVYKLFPESGGLLPFAQTDNGNVLYWKTEGGPDEWRVVIFDPRESQQFEFPGGMTEFLAAVLTRRVECRAFPRDFPSASPVFDPC